MAIYYTSHPPKEQTSAVVALGESLRYQGQGERRCIAQQVSGLAPEVDFAFCGLNNIASISTTPAAWSAAKRSPTTSLSGQSTFKQ
jgi:hypothetical protein